MPKPEFRLPQARAGQGYAIDGAEKLFFAPVRVFNLDFLVQICQPELGSFRQGSKKAIS